jgi:hypothetical protein
MSENQKVEVKDEYLKKLLKMDQFIIFEKLNYKNN